MTETIVATNSVAPTFVEKRAFPRRRSRVTAAIIPADRPLAPGVRAVLVDISQGGVGFTTGKELVVGQRILIEMQTSISNSQPARLEAEVRWVAPDTRPGQFRVGCCWTHRLTYSDLLRYS